MTEKKTDTLAWGFIGKLSVLIALFWTGIQIFNYFFKAGEYETITKGNHSFYETSPLQYEANLKNLEYKALVKTIIKNEGSLKDYNLDSLLIKLKLNNNSKNKLLFDQLLEEQGFSTKTKNEYSSLWTFSIKNTGNKPLNELALELPFEGTYKIILPNNVVKSNSFRNKIEIGELRPSYEAYIYCWILNSSIFIENDEEKSRFTHKNGWISISYPVEVNGIYAWNKKLNDAPFIFGIGILTYAFILIFSIGKTFGAKNNDQMKVETKEDNL